MPPKKHAHIKLTPIERRELNTQKKLERTQRKIERKKQSKRDHLAREVKCGEITYKRCQKDWTAMLYKIAVPRIRQDLEFAWHNFERVVDCKDFTISLLMDQIRDSEEQRMHSFRAHSEHMEEMMGIFYVRLEDLQKDFKVEVRLTEERCYDEFEDMKELANENFDYLKTMIYRLEVERKEHNRMKKGEYLSRLDEIEVKEHLRIQQLKANLEKKYQTIFDDMMNFLKNFQKQIKDRRKEHDALKEQDDVIQELMGHQFKQIKKLYDTIRRLKQKFTDVKQTMGSKLIDLQLEKGYFNNSFLTLKKKLEDDKKADFNKLARLSGCCAEVFDHLEHLNKKGAKILSLSAVCRKLETLQEKILPFPVNPSDRRKFNILNRYDIEECEGLRPELELFWQRIGQAFGSHYALLREKKFLMDENAVLMDTHNAYCDRLTCPPVQAHKETVTLPKIETAQNTKQSKFKTRRSFVYRQYRSNR